MGNLLAIFFWESFLSLLFVAATGVLVWRLAVGREGPKGWGWLLGWSVKGLLLPFLFWALMNLGLSWDFHAFIPEIQAAQNKGGDWLPVYLQFLGKGLFILSADWAALTLGWAVWRTGDALEEAGRRNLKSLCWTYGLGLVLPAGALLWWGGLPLLGCAAAVILVPIAAYAPGIVNAPKLPPLYSRAVARMKLGKYAEAEWEIIRELEKCEDDFEGWMMMAELYANHFHDLAEAERTILELCGQPIVTPSQVSVALHRLADWQLKLAGNPEAARRALQMVCDRCRGTHLAHMAQLRLSQLPGTVDELREQQHASPIHLPALGDQFDQAPASDSKLERRKAATLANHCVDRLIRDPNDVPAREKLARLCAEHLDQAGLGLEQLRLLLDMSGPTESQRAEWLGLMAAWQLRYRHDEPAARDCLQRLLREFPHSPQALAATRRLQLLDAQHKQQQAAHSAPAPRTIRLSDPTDG